MATTIDGTSSSATASLQRPVLSSTDPSSGSDNRAVGNSRQQERQTQEAARQRSDEAFRLDIRSQDSRTEETRAGETREGESADAARQTQQSQAQQSQNRQPPQDERETSSLQVNFSANGNVNTATSPNRAGQFISLSV